MKKLCLAILVYLGLASGAFAQVGLAPFACNQIFQVSQAAVSLTKIVTAGTQVITLCGYTYNTGGAAGTMQLEYGTGTNCATGTKAITPAWSLGVNGVLPDHPGFVTFSLPNGNDLCLVTTGTGPNLVLVYYTVQ
jgi:hypothetical protein